MFSSSSYPALDTHEYENDRNPIENWNAYLRSIGMSTEPDHLDSSSDSNSNGTHSTSSTIMIDNEKNGDDDDEKMIHKFRHRNDILEATVYHRCVHPHNGIADTCRNVALILHDRQKYGAGWNRITLRQRRLLKRLPRTRRTTIDNGTDNNNPNRLKRNRGSNDNHICTDDNDDKRRYYYDESDDESDDYDDDESSAESPQYKDGERSPSTVFESPITTPQIHPLSVTTTSSTTIPSLSTPTVPGSASSIGRTSGDRDTIQASDGRFRNEFRNSGAALMEVDPIGSLTSATPAVDIAVKELTTSTSAAVGSMKGQGRFRAQFESAHKETAATVIADELTPPRSIFTKGDNNADIVVQPRRIRGSRSRRDSKSKVKKDKKKFHHVSYPMQLSNELRMFAEYTLTTKYHSSFLGHLGGNDPIDEQGIRPISSAAVSTISVAFSQDGKTMASTHGDHTVKITCCATGRLLQSLDGHPRTPWTVKYHPINSNVVASGCLGFQVRVWNWFKKTCLQMIRLEYAIISLSFHPSGTILAIANGTRLHFWGIDVCDNDDTQLNTTTSGITSNQLNVDPAVVRYNSSRGSTDRNINVAGVVSRQNSGSGNNSSSGSQSTSNSRASVTPMLIELDQKHMLRCVHFPPNGTSLIIGGANPPIVPPDVLSRSGRGGNAAGGANGNGLSFYLRMWKFDLKKAFESVTPPPSASASAATTSSNSTGTDVVAPLGLQQHPPLNQRNMLMARRGIITNVRTITLASV
jgi:WD domain, G-beta repeat